MVASLGNRSVRDEVGQSAGSEIVSQSFDFGEFFHGHTRASGWFCDRFGNPRRHFCGDFYGFYQDSQFVLDEKLYYTDGVYEERVWRVEVDDTGVFSAESESLIGKAVGQITGNTLAMKYSMKVKIEQNKSWELDMKDMMILQPDGSLHNITRISKWGVRIGTVSAQYLHHDGDRLCIDEPGNQGIVSGSDSSARHLSSVGK